MTMPNERMRALRWGRELLDQIAQDLALPEPLRERARSLHPEYPGPSTLVQWLAKGDSGLPVAWGEALTASARLFNEVRLGGQGCAETRKQLLFTQRHFPEPNDIEPWTAANGKLNLTEWLLPENYYQ